MIDEAKIKKDWESIDGIEKILSEIGKHELSVHDHLADIVASLCNIDKMTMLGSSEKAYVAQVRWLFWYAYRYMTGETFEKIGRMTHDCGGHKFASNGIGQGVNKMSALINSDPIWQRRWTTVKRIIKLREQESEVKVDNAITINIPRGLREKINIIIKEK